MTLLLAVLSVAVAVFGSSAAAAAPARESDPQAATQPQAPYEQASVARQFALSYLDFWSRPNAATLFASPVFYASRVRFHGRTVRADELLAEKARFVRRWPIRRYEPRLETLDTHCRGQVCIVRTRFDFLAVDEARGRRSAGRGDLELAMRFVAGRPYIFRETSAVTHRGAVASAGPAAP